MGDIAIGPRVYLVGRILQAMLRLRPCAQPEALAAEAVRLADLTLDAMGWSDGKPHTTESRDPHQHPPEA